MKGVELAVEIVRVPKKRHSEILIEEIDQSGELAKMIDSEETKEDEEIPLISKRQTGVIIGSVVHQEIDEEALYHSKKLKGAEGMSKTAKYLLEMKQAHKSSKKDFIFKQHPIGPGEGSGMALEVLDGLSGSSSYFSSDSNDEIEDISSDDERSEMDDTKKVNKANAEKADDSKKAKNKKDVEEHAMDKKTSEEQPIDEQAEINQPNKFINNNPDVSINDVLKEPIKAEIQLMVEVLVLQEKTADQRPQLSEKREAQASTDVILKRLTKLEMKVEAMSKFNIPKAIDKSLQAHLKKNLPKDVPNFAVDGDELIQDGMVDDTEMAQDDDMDVNDMPHDDALTQDRSKWFKQDIMVGTETLDPKWCKEPNVDDALV
nr:hypothetical protein [Tanacetum cinerariifolium]